MSTIYPNRAVTDVTQSPNFSGGRPYGAPDQIVIHHWGVDGQRHQNVVNYLCRMDGNSSAHYVASGGRVTQIVSDSDRAWHAGSSGNPRGIGIECRPEMDDDDWATVAGLIAAIRAEHGHLPLVGHRDHMQTACPGRWYQHLAALSAAADSGDYGSVSGGGSTEYGAGIDLWSATSAPAGIQLDGYGTIPETGPWDIWCWRRLARVMGQWGGAVYKITQAVQHMINRELSAGHIRTLTGDDQLVEDGDWGERTTRCFQLLLWTRVTGDVWDRVEWSTVSDWCDGVWGPATDAVSRAALNQSWASAFSLCRRP